jgi:anhydro-N-acetylmuramic acid kinase
MHQRAMHVVGVMSGTSADGIDVAVTRVCPQKQSPRLTLLAHELYPFPAKLRAALLASMDAKAASVADLSRLGTRLGFAYAEAVRSALRKHSLEADLIGCHGQTVYHQAKIQKYLGRKIATTWQLLDPAPICEMLRLPVVSDFRPADVAAGGQGAPLVPLFDYEFFRSAKQDRVLLNLGGIGNITLLPAGATADSVIAFDTGPANMVIDALMQLLFNKRFDRNGAVAARGTPVKPVIESALLAPFFLAAPPKSAGREQFGAAFTERLLAQCRKHSASDADTIATATQLSATSVALAISKFARKAMPRGTVQLIVSGGGARNATLMRWIKESTSTAGCTVFTTDELGMPSEAKEAAAFALLAWNTWHGLPGNMPSATGARRPVVLGRISHA